jgi:hypothetical protein
MQPAKKLMLRLLLAAFVAAGIYLGVASVADFRQASEAMSWPTAQGTITKSIKHGVGAKRWHELLYVYKVDGSQYSGHRATFRDGLIRYRTSDRVRMYPEGRNIAVYFSPDQPSISVLETGIYWPGVLFSVFATCVLTVVGGGGLFLTFR